MALGQARSWSRRTVVPALAVVLAASALLVTAPPASGRAALISHGSRAVPVIALTVDDGFSAANCRSVAEILKAKGATATFFPTAGAVAGAPATWRAIAAMGFPIGNHTVGHRDMTLMSYAAIVANLRQDRAIVEGVIGRPMLRVLRPPYGAWNGTMLDAAGAAGFPVALLWDTTFADTGVKTDAGYLRMATKGTYGSVVLFHCGPRSSVRILPAVIDAYRARGIGFVTVPELLRLQADPGSWRGFDRVTPGGWSPTPAPTPAPTAGPDATPAPPRPAIADVRVRLLVL